MYDLQRLVSGHAAALLRFERENRAWFARSVPDRGDDYFADFDARHAQLLAEQAAGRRPTAYAGCARSPARSTASTG